MNLSIRKLAWLFAVATLGMVGITSAKSYVDDFGLKPTVTDCDGRNTYKYIATWKGRVEVTSWAVRTANCQQVGRAVCDAAGQCSATANACVDGPAWVQVVGTVGRDTRWQRVVAPWPYVKVNDQDRKKSCP